MPRSHYQGFGRAHTVAHQTGDLRDGKIEYDLVTKWVDEGIRLRTEKPITLNQWHHVTLSYTGSRWASGVKIYVDGETFPSFFGTGTLRSVT